MRSLTVSLLLLLGLLSMGLCDPVTTLAVSDQPSVAQSAPTEDVPLPLYQPPKKLIPRARVGGGLRGTDGSDPVLVALVPDHVGLTVKKAPVLNWFLSKPTTYPLKFTLIDIRSSHPLMNARSHTGSSGVQSILSNIGACTEPDVNIAVHLRDSQSNSPSQEYVAAACLERLIQYGLVKWKSI